MPSSIDRERWVDSASRSARPRTDSAFTNERWGAAQRRRYLALLGRALKSLALNPAQGRLRDDVGHDCRSFRKGRHVIFYRTVEDGIDVVRILHDAMDPLPACLLG